MTQCRNDFRVRFLLGGRHGDFKFLPPAGYSPCYEALLPKEKMHIEAVKDYKRDHEGIRDLLGTTQFLSQSSFIPTPVDTSQVRTGQSHRGAVQIYSHNSQPISWDLTLRWSGNRKCGLCNLL